MHIRSLFIVPILLISLTGCIQQKQGRVLKLAHGLDPSHPVHKAMVYMADRCREISNGALTIEIYPSGQLGSEQQCVELLQIGSLAITKVSAAVLDGAIGKELLLSTEPFWIRGLCFYDAGSRSFYTIDKPIYGPDDLKGLKIRVMKSITAMEMVKAQGGSPTPISWGELYTALQSGVVDGAENNPPSFYTSHHYEVCKYYSLNEHTMVPDVLIISMKVWNKLSDQEKKWLQQAADESVPVERRLWAESEKESLEAVEKAGVTIIHPDKKPFADKVAPLLDSYKKNAKLYDLITRIREVE
jgi:TRAP-type C4-dicarboxylate transport system substrate-binding protein